MAALGNENVDEAPTPTPTPPLALPKLSLENEKALNTPRLEGEAAVLDNNTSLPSTFPPPEAAAAAAAAAATSSLPTVAPVPLAKLEHTDHPEIVPGPTTDEAVVRVVSHDGIPDKSGGLPTPPTPEGVLATLLERR